MKFRYVGDAPEGSIDAFGVRFRPGEVSDVTDPAACRKLAGNRFFEKVEGDASPSTAEAAPSVHEPVAVVPSLEDQARALGIKVDGRWSERRLRVEIDKVRDGGSVKA